MSKLAHLGFAGFKSLFPSVNQFFEGRMVSEYSNFYLIVYFLSSFSSTSSSLYLFSKEKPLP